MLIENVSNYITQREVKYIIIAFTTQSCRVGGKISVSLVQAL